jgi:predicted amidohydrolase YtcJ
MFFGLKYDQNVHAIGDRANGIVLDAFQAALKGHDVKQLRPRLEHAQILTKADIKRIASLGRAFSIFPFRSVLPRRDTGGTSVPNVLSIF